MNPRDTGGAREIDEKQDRMSALLTPRLRGKIMEHERAWAAEDGTKKKKEAAEQGRIAEKIQGPVRMGSAEQEAQ